MKLPFQIPDAVIDWLVRRAEANPYYHLDGYMRRGWVFRLGPRHQSSRYRQSSTGWFSARIHHILRSDKDRDLHDHPQDYCSIILRGGYTELTPVYVYKENLERVIAGTKTTWYGPGSALFRRAEDLHRLLLPAGPTISLFITGPRRREWGFQTSEGWVPWKEYEARGERAPYAAGLNDELDTLLHQAIDSVYDRAMALSAADPDAFVAQKGRRP